MGSLLSTETIDTTNTTEMKLRKREAEQHKRRRPYVRKPKFPFLRLPIELRLLCYEYMFAETRLITRVLVPSNGPPSSLIRLCSTITNPICFVSHRIHSEVAVFILTHTRVHVLFGHRSNVLQRFNTTPITRGSGYHNGARFNLRNLSAFHRFTLWPIWYTTWDTERQVRWDAGPREYGERQGNQPRYADQVLSNILKRSHLGKLQVNIVLDKSFWLVQGGVSHSKVDWWGPKYSMRCAFVDDVAMFAGKFKDGIVEVVVPEDFGTIRYTNYWFPQIFEFLDGLVRNDKLRFVEQLEIPE